MPRPRRVLIEGKWVPVGYVKTLGRFKDYGYRVSGLWKHKGIQIVKGQTRFNERATFLHESMHEIWKQSGLDQFLSTKTEELILAVLDAWLLKMLRDNPKVREYLFEDEV